MWNFTWKNLHQHSEQKEQLQTLSEGFPGVTKRCAGIVEHEIHVGDASPIRQKTYQIPHARELAKKELDDMLEANIIRPLTSPCASPIVLVGKKDGGLRFCVNYRKLNKVAKFDSISHA